MISKCSRQITLLLGLFSSLFLLYPVQSLAQTGYPTRAINIVVPFAAGGPTDTVARVIAQAMSKPMGGAQLIVENKAGAGGTIAAEYVAKAAPDGYTLLLHHIGMSTAPALYRTLRYNAVDSFEPIGLIADVPMTLVGKPGLAARDFKEFLAYIKANKATVTYANAGIGSASHLCGMLFMSAIETDVPTVPYKGTGPAMNDLLGGQVDLLCDQTTQTVPMIKENRIKVYGVTTLKRLSALPNVPTLDEQGNKGFEVKVWHGMYAPKGTPKDVLDKLNAALRAAMNDPMVKQRLADLSSEIPSADKISSEGLRTHLDAEIKKWGPVITKAGIYAD